MRIGVISDTHVSTVDDLPAAILSALSGVDLIVHAGDFTERAVLDGLSKIAEVKAVFGNMDSGILRKILPEKDTFEFGGRRIGLVHGWGGSWGIADKIREVFDDEELIIYGHSHQSWKEFIRGSILFNPGRARESFGLIDLDDEITAEILRL